MAHILYFMRGMPTEAQRAECGAANAKMRDASAWVSGDFVETCDAVMGAEGDIPEPYKGFPRHSVSVTVDTKAADAADGNGEGAPDPTPADPKPDKADKSKGKTKAADAADGDTSTP